ncbi:hypothetical protein Tco_0497373, partial [Tanacetum coccineum]
MGKVMSRLKVKLMRLPKLWILMAKILTDLTVWKTQNVESYQDGNGLGTLQHSESSKQLNLGKVLTDR